MSNQPDNAFGNSKQRKSCPVSFSTNNSTSRDHVECIPSLGHGAFPTPAEQVPHIFGENDKHVENYSGCNFNLSEHYNPAYLKTSYNPAYPSTPAFSSPLKMPPASLSVLKYRRRVAQYPSVQASPAQDTGERRMITETFNAGGHVHNLGNHSLHPSHEFASGADPWTQYNGSEQISPEIPFFDNSMKNFFSVMYPDGTTQVSNTAGTDNLLPERALASEQASDQSLPAYSSRSLGNYTDPDIQVALGFSSVPPLADCSSPKEAVSDYDASYSPGASANPALSQNGEALPGSPYQFARGRKPDNEQKYRANVKYSQDELKDAVDKAPEGLRPAGLRLNTKASIQSSAAKLIRHLVACCKHQAGQIRRLKQENQSLQQLLQNSSSQQLACPK